MIRGRNALWCALSFLSKGRELRYIITCYRYLFWGRRGGIPINTLSLNSYYVKPYSSFLFKQNIAEPDYLFSSLGSIYQYLYSLPRL